VSDAKPWEDESLKGEYYKEKKRMQKPPQVGSPKPKAKLPSATDAWGQAAGLEKRNKRIDKATAPIRKALPGQDK
jgi:hypothetical protein